MQPKEPTIYPGIIIGTLVSVIISVGGYLMVRNNQTEFGSVMFILVPFVSGFAVAAITRKTKRIAASCLMGGIITLGILFFTSWEGYLCILMSLPLLAGGIALGAAIGYLTIGKRLDKKASSIQISIVILALSPFFIGAADRFEKPYRHALQTETFTSQIDIDAPINVVWASMLAIPRISGPKPFLLRVGLPVPLYCTFSNEGLGGERVCYFDSGIISQRISEWNAPTELAVTISESTLPGRHWLSFSGAGYRLEPNAKGGTTLYRYSSIGTRLYPRLYWRQFERWGVTSEHEYVLQNIKRIAEDKKG